MTTTVNEKRIAVVGAGLVGSLLAITLRKLDFEVDVFEARPDIRQDTGLAGRSINLIVTKRGTHALDQVGLTEKVLEITTPVYGRMLHDLEGNETFQPYGKDKSECNHSVSRAELNKLLLTEAENKGANVFFEHPLEKVTQGSDHPTLNFKDTNKDYAYIFGTDGATSKVRASYHDLEENFQESMEGLGVGYKELVITATKDGNYKLEKNALHIWPRGQHFLMALPNNDGSFTATLYLPETGGGVSFEEVKTADKAKKLFETYYKDAIPLIPDLEQDYETNPVGFLGTVRCTPWTTKERTTLLGDAAHAIVPFFGQGMNAGFEDVTVLVESYKKEKELKPAIKLFEQTQTPNAHAIADMAIENYYEMAEKVADPRFLLMKKVEHLLEATIPELYRTRYAQVVYSLIPYKHCQEAGKIQKEILAEVCEGIKAPAEVDLEKAKSLTEKRLLPYFEEHRISTLF